MPGKPKQLSLYRAQTIGRVLTLHFDLVKEDANISPELVKERHTTLLEAGLMPRDTRYRGYEQMQGLHLLFALEVVLPSVNASEPGVTSHNEC